MKKILVFTISVFFSLSLYAQQSVQVGDEFVIEEPASGQFEYVQFPKGNFVRKKGSIANYKRIYNKRVKVVEVITKDNGEQWAVLKLADGTKFFNAYPTIRAQVAKAVEKGELSK